MEDHGRRIISMQRKSWNDDPKLTHLCPQLELDSQKPEDGMMAVYGSE